MVIGGSLSVPTGIGNGTLTVNVRDQSAGSPIIAVDLTDQGLTNVTTIPSVSSAIFLYQGEPVNTTNPLSFGATTTGSLQTSNTTAGATYTMTIHVTFESGGSYFQTLSLTCTDLKVRLNCQRRIIRTKAY